MLVLNSISLAVLCLLLAACGGGGGGSASDASVAGSAAVDIAQNPASVSGRTIPSATSINDSSGAVWTLVNGVVFRAQKSTNLSGQATLLLWYAGKMYATNAANAWYVWSVTSWVASSDPRVAGATSTAQSLTAVTAFSRRHGGGTVASTAATATATTATTAASAAPRVPGIEFYGMNGHYQQGGLSATVPLSTQAAVLADLGVTRFRQDMYSTQDIDLFADTVIPGPGSAVQVQPAIIASPWDDPSLHGAEPTEASAYTYAYTSSAYAATRFAGIPLVEFGNEYDLDSHNAPIVSDGEVIADYDYSTFPIWRGSLRGAEDGWRSVDTSHTTRSWRTRLPAGSTSAFWTVS